MQVNKFSFHAITIPIIAQSLITISMSVADMFLAIPLGKSVISALALVTSFIMAILSIQLGIAQSIFIRVLKEKKFSKQNSYLFYGICLSSSLSLIIAIILRLSAKNLFTHITNNTEITVLATTYFSYMVVTLPITAITLSIGFFLRAHGQTLVTFLGFTIEVPINLAVSYWLMYGSHLNMGIEGAAIGSLVGRSTRLIWMLGSYIRYRIKNYLSKPIHFNFLSRNELFEYLLFAMSLSSTSFGTGIAGVILISLYSGFSTVEFSIFSMFLPLQGVALTVANSIASTVSVFFKNSKDFSCSLNDWRYCAVISAKYLYGITFITYILGFSYITIFKFISSIHLLIIYAFLTLVQGILKGYASIYSNGYLKTIGRQMFCLYVEQISQWVILIPVVYFSHKLLNQSLVVALSYALLIDVLCVIVLRKKTLHCIYKYTGREVISQKYKMS